MKFYLQFISALFFTVCCGSMHAQAYTWSETEFTIPNEEATEAVKIRTFDGGDLICATTNDGTIWNTFMYLIKLDAAGNQEWTQRYVINLAIQQVIQCPDSSFVVSGEDGDNWQGYRVIRVDQHGNVLYSKQLYVPGHPTMYPPYMLARNNNNVYFGSTVVDTINYSWHWHVFEMDPQGNILSSDIYHDYPQATELVALDTFSNGDLFLAGAWRDTSLNQFCPLIDRVDTGGAIVWSRKFSASTSAFKPQCIVKAGTDKFIVSTHYLRPVPFGYTGGMTYIKMDGAGNVVWSYRYEDYVVQFGQVISLPNSETCVIGGDMGYKTMFMRIDSAGMLLHSSCFQWRYFSSMNKVPGGSLSMCGINYNNKKIILEKTSPNGESCTDSTYTFVQGGFSVITVPDSGHYATPMQSVTQIFPFTSPVLQMSVVCSSVDVPEPVITSPSLEVLYGEQEITINCSERMQRLEIFDAEGKLVQSDAVESTRTVINTCSLAPGMYVVHAVCENGISTTKIMIGQ